MELSYRVILEADAEDGGYVVRIPAFPHAHTCGDSVEEALANAREIIELEIEDRTFGGEPIPAGDADRAFVHSVTVTFPVASASPSP
jgi:predicted RNase H-like HicB family nuclease